MRSAVTEAFSRSVIEVVDSLLQACFTDVMEVSFLREVLA
ncbi:hypothetical protein BH11PSE12_BH11PSE12_23970 [soil metagenome]